MTTKTTETEAPNANGMPAGMSIGMDFGTSNSVLALSRPGESPTAVQFSSGTNFPSILCFYLDTDEHGQDIVVGVAGQEAITTRLKMGSDCRLILSIKSYVANPTFTETSIFGQKFSIENLVSIILAQVRKEAEAAHGALGVALTSGRPVQFAGYTPSEPLALERLGNAYGQAGFEDVKFGMEPLAAAYAHVRQLEKSETCLVVDLGGGTSDFSLVRFHPHKDQPLTEPLSHGGVGIAGDRLDYQIIRHVIAPLLGRGTHFTSFGKRLELPSYIYAAFQSWSELSMLKGSRTMRDLAEMRRSAEDPEAIDRLIYIIENELGYQLYRAVSDAKAQLSTLDEVLFEFSSGPVNISETILRTDFEAWIADDVANIAATMEEMFETSNFLPQEVSRVFMTGGTSFVPAIRQKFETLFGANKIGTGNEFISVAAGLALLDSEARR